MIRAINVQKITKAIPGRIQRGINMMIRMCGFFDVLCNRAKNKKTISHISKKEKT
jgi:hypothetical protein